MKPLAVLAYDFPHRKTHDFLTELAVYGLRDVIVLAAPLRKLSGIDKQEYFSKTLAPSHPLPASKLCASFGFQYYRVAHEDSEEICRIQKKHEISLAVVAGARIIKSEVINIFPDGIVNFHPGKIPETSGLDALYYSIKKNVAPGVTTHFIDNRVDAGRLIYFDEISVDLQSTPEIIQENTYRAQTSALRRFLFDFERAALVASEISRPSKNLPMTSQDKMKTLLDFDRWRANQYFAQTKNILFESVQVGDCSLAELALNRLPSLLSTRNDQGWTPLIVACFNHHEEVAKLLLDRGADVNESGFKGTTPLMYAKTRLLKNKSPDYRFLDFLINSGADIAKKDIFGKNVIDYALDENDHVMVEYLSGHIKNKSFRHLAEQ